MHDTYRFTSAGNGDTFKWEFHKKDTGSLKYSYRTIHIGNIKRSSGNYEYTPEVPVFLKTGTIKLPLSIANGAMTVTRDGTALNDGDTAKSGDKLVFTVTPDEGYEQVSGVISGEKTVTDGDFAGSVYTPEPPVFAKKDFVITNNSPQLIDVAQTAQMSDNVTITVRTVDSA